jgi:hypothetical protein
MGKLLTVGEAPDIICVLVFAMLTPCHMKFEKSDIKYIEICEFAMYLLSRGFSPVGRKRYKHYGI